MKCARCLGLTLLLVSSASIACAQPPDDDPNVPQTIELTVAPAAEPRPALKYRLLPRLSERTPGNAAQIYYRAMLHQKQLPREYWQQYADRHIEQAWASNDPQVFPAEEVAKWLESQNHVLESVKEAAFREYCNWDLRVQDLRGMATIAYLLHDVQQCRELGRLLQVRAHHQILTGHPDEAFDTLRLGYQLARDVSQTPFLINNLVGFAIAQMMNDELVLLIDHSDANYYWALAALPHPLVDLGPSMEFEMGLPRQIFPYLKDAETAQRTPDEWRRLMIEGTVELESLAGNGPPPFSGWQAELAAAAMIAKLYPVAKDELIAGGMDRQRVEELPVGQVVAIHTARSIDYVYHEFFKISLLPYDEAMRRMPQVLRQLTKEGSLGPNLSGRTGLPIANLLLPGIGNVLQANARLSRAFASMQTIEAIRMHAGVTGKLPATLAEVTVVPVPNNPATNLPFPYKLDAATGVATLEVPAVADQQPRHDGKRYVIRLEKE